MVLPQWRYLGMLGKAKVAVWFGTEGAALTFWNGHSSFSYAPLGLRDALRFGDYVVPRRVEWNFAGTNGDPDFHAVFEVRDQRPQCVELHATAAERGRPVRTTDMERMELDKLTVAAFATCAMKSIYDPVTNVTEMFPVMDERELWEAINGIETAVKARRRGTTSAELERVADVYREHRDGINPAGEVEARLGYGSLRTAQRRIKQAEEAGLLPPTQPFKKRG